MTDREESAIARAWVFEMISMGIVAVSERLCLASKGD